MPSALPLTRSAAAATSSATARVVTASGRPSWSVAPRRSSSTARPAQPRARSVRPSRHGRPGGVAEHDGQRLWQTGVRRGRAGWCGRRPASASGSSGSTSRRPDGPVFEASTPAAAITGPATDSTTRVTPSAARRSATTRTVPAATASSRVPSQVSPSALETTLLDTTRQSPGRSPTPDAVSASSSCSREVRAGAHLAEPEHRDDAQAADAEVPAAPRARSRRHRGGDAQGVLGDAGGGRRRRSSAAARRTTSTRARRRRGAGVGGVDEPAVEEVVVEAGDGRRGRLDPDRLEARVGVAAHRPARRSGVTPRRRAQRCRAARRAPRARRG